MSEYLVEDQGIPLNTWCPECGGPVKDEKAAMAYCVMHQPSLPMGHVGFFGEAGGDGNKAICDYIHRKEITQS